MVLDLENFKRLISAELVVKAPPAVTQKRKNEWTTEIKYLGVTADSKRTHRAQITCLLRNGNCSQRRLYAVLDKFSTAHTHLGLFQDFEQYDPTSNIFPCPRILLPR
jgi:hypothetical protein